MEDVVDRVEVSEPTATPPGSAVGRGWAARLTLSWGLITARQRPSDDIPSVVRALLVGYDEV